VTFVDFLGYKNHDSFSDLVDDELRDACDCLKVEFGDCGLMWLSDFTT
jgi:hypothetical protein